MSGGLDFLFLLNKPACSGHCWETRKLEGKRNKTKAGDQDNPPQPDRAGIEPSSLVTVNPDRVRQPLMDSDPDPDRLQKIFAGWR